MQKLVNNVSEITRTQTTKVNINCDIYYYAMFYAVQYIMEEIS